MTGKYGFPLQKWDEAKEEIRQILIACAKLGNTVTYSELISKVKIIELEPQLYALAEMLGEISTAEDNAGRGLLTVLVVRKVGDMMPGQGFFDLAESRGRDISYKEKFWIDESNRVFAQWK